MKVVAPNLDATLRRLIDSLPKPDYSVPKEGVMTVGYGLPGRGERAAPMKSTYRGIDVETMSREELIAAVHQLGNALNEANRSHVLSIGRFADLAKAAARNR